MYMYLQIKTTFKLNFDNIKKLQNIIIIYVKQE